MSDEHLDIIDTPDGLFADVQSMIEQTRAGVAQTVNTGIARFFKDNELTTERRLSRRCRDNW